MRQVKNPNILKYVMNKWIKVCRHTVSMDYLNKVFVKANFLDAVGIGGFV